MNDTVVKQSYSAVLCRSCREPIPVPAMVLQMSEIAHPDSHDKPQPERVFKIRCRACEVEMPYRMGEIVRIEGEPRGRRTVGQAPQGLSSLSRAAGA